MGAIGIPELLVILIIGMTWLIPLGAAVWALITLRRLRDGQRAVEVKLDNIAHLLQK